MFVDPEKNLKALGLKEDNVVVDLGAGTGFYSILASHIVTSGKVYAIEIQKDFVDVIKSKIKTENIQNMEVFWANIEKVGGTKLADKIADVVILSNVLFQVEDKDKTIEEARRILKNDGQVLLIDWLEDSSLVNQRKINIISKEKMREMFEKYGFIFIRDIDTGLHHYGMILRKNEK